jgi:glycerophosphoryl diester phosphodiesterase
MELLRGDRGVVCVGHRGAAALAVESSLAAVEAAAAHGADAVELDVVRADDGALAVAHEAPPPLHALRLDDALELAASLGLAVQLDVKRKGLEEDVVGALRRHGLLERSFVSSFAPAILRAFAAIEPGLPRALTYPEDRHGLSERPLLGPVLRPSLACLRALLPVRLPRLLGSVGARAATLNVAVVSPQAIRVCHRLGVAVFVWTVNERALARTLVESGVDGIITDDPRLVRPRLQST